MNEILIRDIGDFVEKEVKLTGWLYNVRSKGKIAFLQLRDGTGRIQGVAGVNDVSPECFELIKTLKMESSVKITGTVRKDSRAPSGYELTVSDVEAIHIPPEDFPIAKQAHGEDFLLSNRHLWLRSHNQYHIIRIRNEVIWAVREYFRNSGFTCVDTPILTGAIGESAGTLFQTEYFDLGQAYLAQTGQLYLEAAAAAFRDVYCFGPTFRAEKSKTRRHLTEFWMVEAEMAFCGSDRNMDIQEGLVRHIITHVLNSCTGDLKELERDTAPLEKVITDEPFPRITYTEAVKTLQGKGSEITWGEDLGGTDETLVSEDYEKPVFICNYPKEAKAFYMAENPDEEGTVLCDDLIAPGGHGEIIGASERMTDHDRLLAKIEEQGLPRDGYEWYLDLRKYGSFQHSGFGMGIERTVGWLAGIPHVREAIPFPRMMKRLYP